MAGSRRIGTTTHPHTHLFTQVDRSGDPDFFVRFMDETQKLDAIQTSRKLMLERIALAAGQSVLDVGCGPGTDLVDMVELVGPAGRLAGLDASEVMIAEARRRALDLHLPISFEVGEVQALPFPNDTFDVCRAARLLEHLPDAERALAEMVRVTRPGGRIAVFDFDWDTRSSTIQTRRPREPSSCRTPTRSGTGGSVASSRASSRNGTWRCFRSIRCKSSPTTRWPSCSSAVTLLYSRQTERSLPLGLGSGGSTCNTQTSMRRS